MSEQLQNGLPPLPEEAIPERPPDVSTAVITPAADTPSEEQESEPLSLAARLAKDPHFTSLSKAERIKYYQETLAKEQASHDKEEDTAHLISANIRQHGLDQAEATKKLFGSTKSSQSSDKVSKKDVKKYKKIRREKADRKKREWLLE